MNEIPSPNGRFNLLNRAKKDNLVVTPNYRRILGGINSVPSTPRSIDIIKPKTPITSGRFGLRQRAILGGLPQKWESEFETQYQKEQKNKSLDIEYGDSTELLNRPGVKDGAKPINEDNEDNEYKESDTVSDKESTIKKKKFDYKTNSDTKTYDENNNIPTSVKIGNRTLDLKNYTLLDREDWSRLGKCSRIAYEKEDGKIVEGYVLHALYANKKIESDLGEYMLLESYNFKPGNKGTFKWSLPYNEVKHLWMHPGQSSIMDEEYDLRKKFNSVINTKRSSLNPNKSYVSDSSEMLKNLKNEIDNNNSKIDLLTHQNHELVIKIESVTHQNQEIVNCNIKLENDIKNIMEFLTRKFSSQFQSVNYQGIPNNNMLSRAL